ncbi:MAG: hypothetical protein HYZ53_07820 [Planctomycetes bacterium]|nr:hypothetical protein [Planctomycetota bacterium]
MGLRTLTPEEATDIRQALERSDAGGEPLRLDPAAGKLVPTGPATADRLPAVANEVGKFARHYAGR